MIQGVVESLPTPPDAGLFTLDPLTYSYVDDMARLWMDAERAADPNLNGMSLEEYASVARERVAKVFAGEVRWSEASPGDRAVWIGRPRVTALVNDKWKAADYVDDGTGREAMAPLARVVTPPGQISGESPPRVRGPRLMGYRERIYWNFYDTVRVGEKPFPFPNTRSPRGSVRAFSNANVGEIRKCNLQIGFQFPQHAWFVVLNFYAVPLAPIEAVPWTTVTGRLEVGTKLASPILPLRELAQGTLHLNRPYIIPVRQTYGAVIEWDLSEFDQPFDLVLHLEGLLTEDVY